MRNILFLAGITAMTGCGLSEDAFGEQALEETCRILVACEFFADEATCQSESEAADTEGCTYDKDAASECLDGLKAIEGCPDPFALPDACADVYDCPEDSDTAM